MKYFHYILFVLILSCTLFINCAKRGTITGGPKDTIAPVLLYTSPENYSINFDEKTIKLTFDEYIKLDKINQQLIISPPMEYSPEITPMGFPNKTITIKLLDTLKQNTTYSINFGQSVVDNNEGNKYPNLRYVFSTGNYIDSLKVRVRLKDAISTSINSFTKVMLYENENFNDSTIFKQKPLYVANSLDSLVDVTIDNVKEGKYRLIAINEKNNNYKFDPNADKIAFLNTVISTPKDTVYNLVLFKEKKAANFGRPNMLSKNKWLIAAEGNLKDVQIKVSDFKNDLKTAFYKVDKKDSLHVFVPDTSADSLKFEMQNKDFKKEFVIRTRSIKTLDSLRVDFLTSNTIEFNDSIKLTGTTPIVKWDKNYFELMKKDSTKIPFNILQDTLNNQIKIDFEKEESTQYILSLLPGAVEDVFGKRNDSISSSFSTKEFAEYANLNITVSHQETIPLILELIDSKEKVIYRNLVGSNNSVSFFRIRPDKYFIRIIYDENGNNTWDTGNYLMKLQPEKVFISDKFLDVRANWEMNENIILP